MVSYADFVTLLFAVFVVLYAAGRAGNAKVSEISSSIAHALGARPTAVPVPSVNTAPPAASPLTPAPAAPHADKAAAELRSSYEDLRKQLREEIAAGKMDVSIEARGVVITLRDGAFFRSGEDVIDPSAFGSIGRMASILAPLPNKLLLEGHTDSMPIHNSRFRNNWVLSTARSAAVLSLLESRWDIPSSRFEIAGYADNQPTGDNETDAGRARNRRVDVVIVAGSPTAAGASAGVETSAAH
jgi:chemotaxis protein MotB